MMKIDLNTVQPSVSVTDRQTKQTSAQVSIDDSVSKTDQTTHVAATLRLLSAQAGIAINARLSCQQDRQQHVRHRQQVKAQAQLANLESILAIATSVSVKAVSGQSVDADWFHGFLGLAENIYSPAMQELWGKILAVEVASPGSFSLKSLETIRYLTQRDADIFGRAASLACRSVADDVPRLLVGFHQKPRLSSFFRPRSARQLNLSEFSLPYSALLTLIDLKLIYASEIESGEIPAGQQTRWKYLNQTLTLTARTKGTALVFFKFTGVGAELYCLVGKKAVPAYLSQLSELLGAPFDVTVD